MLAVMAARPPRSPLTRWGHCATVRFPALGELLRDRAERDGLIAGQLDARRGLQQEIRDQRERQQADLLLLREDVARYQDMALPERSTERRREQDREGRKRSRGRDFDF